MSPLHSADTDHPVRADLIRMIRRADMIRPRSMQSVIGPSQVGVPCDRSLAYQANPQKPDSTPRGGNTLNASPWAGDPIAAIVGTALHSWLEQAAATDNIVERTVAPERIHPRWITEQVVRIPMPNGENLTGSADLYDTWTGTLIDWKTVGVTSLNKVRSEGDISAQYRTQVHLYGLGFAHTIGRAPDRVAIAFLPRNGPLRDTQFYVEDWDEALALRAVARLVSVLDTDYRDQPAQPSDAACRWCPVPMAECTQGLIWR
jgi:PD-(D/E)XK nuclease superfamily